MDKRNDYYNDWDDQFYGTGPTEPPKSRGGLVALMLILIIFLSGIITVLGVLNIKLFHQLQTRQENELSISFTTESTVPEDAPISMASEPAQYSDAPFVSMDLQQAPAGVENVPAQGGLSLQDIYTRNIDSVVSITCSGRSSTSSGTGVILSQDGYIVTNAHVVEGGSSITVQLTDDRTFSASIVGSDEISDLAVLYIAAEGLTPAQFGDSSSLRVGDTVVAIGDPLGVEFRGTYTNGIVSDGQVIGINTMKIGTYTDSAGVEGLGFAIPSATVKDVVDQLITQGYVSGRPTLGIDGEALSTFYQHYYRMPAGLYITAVERSSDAYTKGIEDGDILISVNGTRVISMDDLKAVLYECEVGQTVQTVIYRAGQQYQVELTLAEDKG